MQETKALAKFSSYVVGFLVVGFLCILALVKINYHYFFCSQDSLHMCAQTFQVAAVNEMLKKAGKGVDGPLVQLF